ncbi:hypothetical protein ColLi_04360 [Colletotrichum liriopes]|uniref:Uncharacterized protein n=1 Tax=Colletotrichum liriopes TaxID=708192 RepID=A0AA37LRC8_9PEZI|nr:hypothetical protein ColLi_04360 [Colletotrichum liriopes]
MVIVGAVEEHVDPTLSRIAQDDKKIWYKKPNLRFLYLILIPTGLGVEWTSGFDSSMMNSLQAVESWFECKLGVEICIFPNMNVADADESRLWATKRI